MTLNLMHYNVVQKEDFKNSEEYKTFEKEYNFLIKIRHEELYNLVVDIINKYGNKNKLANATKICDLLMFMLRDRNLIQDGVQQSYVDLLIASCYLHNIKTVTKEKWNNSYAIREIMLKEYNDIYLKNEMALDPVCDTIEGQLGQNIPIKGSRPNPNTPGELFAMAVSIINKYQ